MSNDAMLKGLIRHTKRGFAAMPKIFSTVTLGLEIIMKIEKKEMLPVTGDHFRACFGILLSFIR